MVGRRLHRRLAFALVLGTASSAFATVYDKYVEAPKKGFRFEITVSAFSANSFQVTAPVGTVATVSNGTGSGSTTSTCSATTGSAVVPANTYPAWTDLTICCWDGNGDPHYKTVTFRIIP